MSLKIAKACGRVTKSKKFMREAMGISVLDICAGQTVPIYIWPEHRGRTAQKVQIDTTTSTTHPWISRQGSSNSSYKRPRHNWLMSRSAIGSRTDVKEFATKAEFVFSQIKDSLPNLAIATIPCVDTSLARDGLGLTCHRSGLIFKLMVVMRALRNAYKAAGWTPAAPGDAPFAWILEISPIFETDTRPLIFEAKQVFKHPLGDPVQPGAATAGSSAYRNIMFFSNMGRKDQFDSI